jgi:hypothetical protein
LQLSPWWTRLPPACAFQPDVMTEILGVPLSLFIEDELLMDKRKHGSFSRFDFSCHALPAGQI